MSVLRGGNSQIAQQIGIFLALGKDTKLHQTLCKEMTAAFAKNKNAGDLERTVKICTLTAKPVGKLDDLLKLSEQSVALGKENEFAAHHYHTLALVHVRMKQYDKALEAVRLADKAEDDSRLQLPDVLICNRAIEAMCLVATEKTDEAKKALAKATPVLTKKLSNQTILYRGDYWHDWLTAKVLHDEALGVVMKAGK
jgi:tetratricopeptide (TPR) repeat protein